MSNAKQHVKNAYPNAIIMHDTHVWGNIKTGSYVLLTELPKTVSGPLIDDMFSGDYKEIFQPHNSVRTLGEFQTSPEACWEEGWTLIQERLVKQLQN